MTPLETVEDFEKLSKVIKNPKSKSYEYCVKCFGFCTACNRITEYEDAFPQTLCKRKCLSCNRIFKYEPTGGAGECYISPDKQNYWLYFSDNDAYAESLKELQRVYSRNYQKKLFAAKRKSYIKKLKKDVKGLNSKIQRLVKLRP